jgi:4-hydroxy-3-polyprenylbenzoate decarboxylase
VAREELIVGVSGGSGALLARRFVEVLLTATRVGRVHLVFSGAGLEVSRNEIDSSIRTPQDWLAGLRLGAAAARRVEIHPNDRVGASIASGSYPVRGMIVIPCSGGTLGAIANGISRDLLQRAADVCLKERRPLVLAFRETPYSLVHVENMRRATLAGAIVAPPIPAFYIGAPDMGRFLDAYCVRAIRLLGLPVSGDRFEWKGRPPAARPARRKRSR